MTHVLDGRAHFGRDELVLRLRGELRIRHLHGDDGGQALAAIVAGERNLFLLRQAGGFRIAVHLTGERRAEARKVRAAIPLRDVVGEAEHVLVVRVVPPQGHFDADAVLLGADHDRLLDQRGLGTVEIAHEGFDAALVHQLLALVLRMALVGEDDAHAGVQEREFAQAVLQGVVVVLHHGEGLGRGQEGHFRAALALGIAHDRERRHRIAMAGTRSRGLAVAVDAQLEPARERVHHRDAHAVQTAGDLVGVLVELTARVQLGHDDLGRRDAFALVDVGWDAAAIVGDGHRAVGVERDRDFRCVAGQRLVDGVVHHLVDHVVQARAVIGIADIHARPLAHRIKALEHLDRFRAIGVSIHVDSRFGHLGSFGAQQRGEHALSALICQISYLGANG